MCSTVRELSVEAEAVLADSMTLVPLTVMVSATPPTFIAIGKVTDCPTVTGTSPWMWVANPPSVNFKV